LRAAFLQGLARFIANDETNGLGGAGKFDWLRELATGVVFGIPMPFILLIIISAAMWVLLHRSVYGRYLYAVGRNEMAARYSGINSARIVASAYIILGLLAGISAILSLFTRTPSHRRHTAIHLNCTVLQRPSSVDVLYAEAKARSLAS
jgi:ribose transport system permease protein